MSEQLKWCNYCKQHKPLACFSKNKTKKDGLQSTCKDCLNARNAKYYTDHQEIIRAQKKDYCVANAEHIKAWRRSHRAQNRERLIQESRARYAANRDEYVARSRQYHAEHRDELLEKSREYDRAHRAKHTALKRKYRAENPEKYKVYTQTRRTRKLSLPNAFDEHDWVNCLTYWDNRCAICGRSVGTGYTIAADHWIPLSDPRPDNPGTVPENMLPLCHGTMGCNNSKKNHEPVAWLFRYLGDAAEQKLSEITAYFESIKAQSTQRRP